MQTLLTFDYSADPVRIVMQHDQPWFVATDVAAILGYRNAPDMVRNLDDDEKGTQIVRTLGGDQELTIISESGLYNAIFRSRRAEAHAFRRWVTGTVLPEIRRTGGYAAGRGHGDWPQRIAHCVAGRDHVFLDDICRALSLFPDGGGRALVASNLRAMGWRRGWIAPESNCQRLADRAEAGQ